VTLKPTNESESTTAATTTATTIYQSTSSTNNLPTSTPTPNGGRPTTSV